MEAEGKEVEGKGGAFAEEIGMNFGADKIAQSCPLEQLMQLKEKSWKETRTGRWVGGEVVEKTTSGWKSGARTHESNSS